MDAQDPLPFGDAFSSTPSKVKTQDGPSAQATDQPPQPEPPAKANNQDEAKQQEDEPETSENEAEPKPFNPKDGIPPFDWQDLETRYMQAMREQDGMQSAIHDEFGRMMNVNFHLHFYVPRNVGSC